jgi:hypothetical protein
MTCTSLLNFFSPDKTKNTFTSLCKPPLRIIELRLHECNQETEAGTLIAVALERGIHPFRDLQFPWEQHSDCCWPLGLAECTVKKIGDK